VRRGARGDAGFTLVEVMVALSVAAVVLLGARMMLGQLADGASRIASAASEADRDANADALLRTLAGRLEVTPERRFHGEPHAVRFHTWCEVPDGWLERCEASIGVLERDTAAVLALTTTAGQVVPLRRGFAEAEILYLRDARGGGDWVRSWGAGITAPVGMGMVLDGDTAIIRIGDRG
jgi:prepilin-type N-terminal cleavage/methylation domain-containing protein